MGRKRKLKTCENCKSEFVQTYNQRLCPDCRENQYKEIVYVKSIKQLRSGNFKKRTKIKYNCNNCNKEVIITFGSWKRHPIMFCKTCKAEKTSIEKYGVKHHLMSDAVKQTRINTLKKCYNVENVSQLQKVKNKIKQTCLEKYGTEYYLASEDSLNKRKQTNLERYGVENPFQSIELMKDCTNNVCYSLDDLTFDSFWELAFYIYHKDKGHAIIREPKRLEYFSQGNKHYYVPDFKIGNRYYEIKGDQFIKRYKNGKIKTLTSPYSHNQELSNDKYKCMKKHNVNLITYDEIQKYIDYFYENYTEDFKESLKLKNKEAN